LVLADSGGNVALLGDCARGAGAAADDFFEGDFFSGDAFGDAVTLTLVTGWGMTITLPTLVVELP
jgi:hypothetical protein